MCLKSSDKPENGDDWRLSDLVCSKCGKLMWFRSRWDDTNGGSCIGKWYQCGDCGNYETD